jgi:hypothetical protein
MPGGLGGRQRRLIERKPISRREFLSVASITALLASFPSPIAAESRNGILYRSLGRAGEKVSMVGLGGRLNSAQQDRERRGPLALCDDLADERRDYRMRLAADPAAGPRNREEVQTAEPRAIAALLDKTTRAAQNGEFEEYRPHTTSTESAKISSG